MDFNMPGTTAQIKNLTDSFVTYTNKVDLCVKTSDLVPYIAQNWDKIEKEINKIEKEKAEKELKQKQIKNARLRSLVKHVHWSEKTCIMYWADGTITKAQWDDEEPFDPEKAILVCMARKLYENTGIYNEVFDKYAWDGWLNSRYE